MKNFILIFSLLLPLWASAQSYSINWYKIAGGGGTSTNGQYTLNGTIGQHDASAPMTGGGYSVTSGFWAFISVAQTAGAPTLYINYSSSGNAVIVHWQNVPGWTLYQDSNLVQTTGWSASPGITNTNGTNYLSISPPTGYRFFRLQHP